MTHFITNYVATPHDLLLTSLAKIETRKEYRSKRNNNYPYILRMPILKLTQLRYQL